MRAMIFFLLVWVLVIYMNCVSSLPGWMEEEEIQVLRTQEMEVEGGEGDKEVRNGDEDFQRERIRRGFYMSGAQLGKETSRTLDYLLYESGYNRRIRPGYTGDPVVININLEIRSMGPVDDNTESYSLDCYFRQTWTDHRLSYNTTGLSELALNWAFLAKIWVPDTFFVNGRKSFLHKITVPNRFVRIAPTGVISYSQRLTIWASCAMDLRKFPLDTQTCHLEIGSFGYTARDVVYKWQQQPYSIDKNVQLAQFSLEESRAETKLGVSSRRDRSGFRNDSSVQLNFVFKRQTGFFILQIYTPLTLIVFCSWVSFWLVKTEKGGEVPARTALGATTVLSIVNLGFGGKAKPKVGYATAMDTYIIICFFAVFAALVEFACINFLDTFIKRFKAWEQEEEERLQREQEEQQRKDEEMGVNGNSQCTLTIVSTNTDLFEELKVILPANGGGTVSRAEEESSEIYFADHRVHTPTGKSENISTVSTTDACVSTEDDDLDEEDEDEEDSEVKSQCMILTMGVLSYMERIWSGVWGHITHTLYRKYSPRIPQMTIYKNTLSVILAIDSAARKLFPFVFICLQATYWTAYLYWL